MNPPSPPPSPLPCHATIAQPIWLAELCDLGAAFESIIIRRCSSQMQALFSPLATNNMPQFGGRLPPACPDKCSCLWVLGLWYPGTGSRVPCPGCRLATSSQDDSPSIDKLTFRQRQPNQMSQSRMRLSLAAKNEPSRSHCMSWISPTYLPVGYPSNGPL